MPVFSGRQADEIANGSTFGARFWYSPKQDEYFCGHIEDYRHRAALVTDTSTIEAKIVLDDVLGLSRHDYNLDPCLFPHPTDTLVFSVDTLGTVTGSKKNAALVEPDFASGSQARANFNLWKNQVLIAFEDGAAKRAAHDLLRMYEQDAALEIAKMRNDQIADVIHAAAHTTTGSDWSTVTTPPYNATNPYTNIHTCLETLYNTYKKKPTWIAMHPTQYDTFVRNSFVSSPLYASRLVTIPEGGQSLTLPGWPTIRIVIDPALTDAEIHVGNERCGILAMGPTESVEFRNELKGYTGYIIRQWLEPKLVDEDAIYEMTTV